MRVMDGDKLGVISNDKLPVIDAEEDALVLILVDNVFDVVNVLVGNVVPVVLIDAVELIVPVIVVDLLLLNDNVSLPVKLVLIDILVDAVDVMD